jgi:hypothetical protein
VNKHTKKDRPGWPTRPDGSFVIPAGEENWRLFCQIATEDQLRAAIEVLQRLPKRPAGDGTH